MNKFLFLALALCAVVPSSGCATLADAQAARGSGMSKVYDKPYDVVWNAVLQSVRSSSLALVSENKDKGTILAQGAIGAFSWGEDVAIFVEDEGGKAQTRVEVVSKRALATNITAPNWDKRIFEDLDKRL